MEIERQHPDAGRNALRRGFRAAAWVCGWFTLTVAFLLCVSTQRLRTVDPLDSASMRVLRSELSGQAHNEELKRDIRALDLLARRAFFAHIAFARAGAWLLLSGSALFVSCLLALEALRPLAPDIGRRTGPEDPSLTNAHVRRAVAVSGCVLLTVALAGAWWGGRHRYGRESVLARTGTADTGERPETDPGPIPEPDLDPVPEPAAWPMFRGPRGLGRAGQQVDAPLHWDGTTGSNVLWSAEVPRPGFSSPIVYEGRVFLSGGDREVCEVYGFDGDTGRLLWRHAVEGVPGAPSTPPDVTADTGYAASTLAAGAGGVFGIFATGNLIGLDAEGRRLWARHLGVPENPYGHASSLLMHRDLLIVQYDHAAEARVLAVSPATGETVWETARAVETSWASPILVWTGAREELILNAVPEVIAYAPRTGALLWRVNCMDGEVAPSPAWDGGIVCVANEYASLVAIRPGDEPEIAWESRDDLPDVSSPLAVEGRLYVATSWGRISCFRVSSGELLWAEDFDDGFYASPLFASGRIYALDLSGTMHVLGASDAFDPLARSPLGESTVCTPAFAGRRAWIRGARRLFCIEERGAALEPGEQP